MPGTEATIGAEADSQTEGQNSGRPAEADADGKKWGDVEPDRETGKARADADRATAATLANLSRRMDALEDRMGSSFGSAGWDSLSKRLDRIEEKVGTSHGSPTLANLSRRMDGLEGRMGSSLGSAGWDSLSKRLDRIEEKVGTSYRSPNTDALLRRIDSLEGKNRSFSSDLDRIRSEVRDLSRKVGR